MNEDELLDEVSQERLRDEYERQDLSWAAWPAEVRHTPYDNELA
jgi:hypothetical protein